MHESDNNNMHESDNNNNMHEADNNRNIRNTMDCSPKFNITIVRPCNITTMIHRCWNVATNSVY